MSLNGAHDLVMSECQTLGNPIRCPSVDSSPAWAKKEILTSCPSGIKRGAAILCTAINATARTQQEVKEHKGRVYNSLISDNEYFRQLK